MSFSSDSTGGRPSLDSLEGRRRRGLVEVRDLEAVRAQRPLLPYEERSLRRSLSLVREMDDQIRALLPCTIAR